MGNPASNSLMNDSELLAFLRVEPAGDVAEQVRNLCRRHRLPYIRIGKLRLFRPAAVESWLSGLERVHTPKPASLARLRRNAGKVRACVETRTTGATREREDG